MDKKIIPNPLAEHVRAYLRFDRRDRIGVLVLLSLVLAVWLLPVILRSFRDRGSSLDVIALETPADAGPGADEAGRYDKEREKDRNYDRSYERSSDAVRDRSDGSAQGADRYNNTKRVKGFWFDPNKLDSAGFRALGLRARTVTTILRFRAKGGRFRQPGDLDKIYGLFPDEVARLLPWVKIEGIADAGRVPGGALPGRSMASGARADIARFRPGGDKPAYAPRVININDADTTAFIRLPLIGSKLANRIIAFRDRLGGFYSIEQIREVYGIQDSVFQVIRPLLSIGHSSPRSVNINLVTIDELRQHPYFKYALASQLVAYRNAHGAFADLSDLKKLQSIDSGTFEKIAPYLVTK